MAKKKVTRGTVDTKQIETPILIMPAPREYPQQNFYEYTLDNLKWIFIIAAGIGLAKLLYDVEI